MLLYVPCNNVWLIFKLSTLSSLLLYGFKNFFKIRARWIQADGIMYKKGVGIICKVDFMLQVSQIISIYSGSGRGG